MDRPQQMKNLLLMAASDGSFSSDEINLLSLRSHRWGLTDDQFAEALSYAMREDAEIAVPDTKEERLELLRELMLVMAADGQLAEAEKLLFARAAARMNISEQEVNQLVDSML